MASSSFSAPRPSSPMPSSPSVSATLPADQPATIARTLDGPILLPQQLPPGAIPTDLTTPSGLETLSETGPSVRNAILCQRIAGLSLMARYKTAEMKLKGEEATTFERIRKRLAISRWEMFLIFGDLIVTRDPLVDR
ncbi:hypothetical protein CONLIGDRAFT_686841 [Coniochaeta ligniaria NRRL 30616]|uniref:Uncharacterized protein n=1 Tax=Coniochaeta ligniaria NRRL 30616 TaxID=1408157 RepID=A0A1J7I607_9PEZI|nr:hypothetical protein CONLIGDRAFT_686841 [Coniochaeta ligniaria NRRL 30616]